MINVWEGVGSDAEATAFCDTWGVDGTVLVDEPGSYIKELGILGVPTNVFVDSDGVVTAVGAVAPEDLEAQTRLLLGEAAELIDPQ